MKNYFQLQWISLTRLFKENGIHPVLALLILSGLFVGLSIYLHLKSDLFAYFYLLLLFLFLIKFSDFKRNELLRLAFTADKYRQVRLIENVLICAPFTLFFLIYGEYLGALASLILSGLMARFFFRVQIFAYIPTPFSRHPYEFAAGFRVSFVLIIAAYLLTWIAVKVDNFYLGLFSIFCTFLITLGYYSRSDNEYYIWTHNKNTAHFLFDKIIRAIIHASMLTALQCITLGSFYFSSVGLIIATIIIGYLYLSLVILGRYAAFPGEPGIGESILISLCLVLPPLLLFALPYLYNKAYRTLNPLLT